MKIVVGITGATGAHMGWRLIEMLHELGHYSGLKGLEALTDAFLGRVLNQLGMANPYYRVWGVDVSM